MTRTTIDPTISPVHGQTGITAITHDASINAVSWPAIFAGATVAAVLSLVLFILGTGLGLSMISPWANQGVEAQTFGMTSVLWVTLTSLAASAAGGYLAGRLRVRWTDIHGDEVFFRDTAHGLLAWGISTLATAALFSSVFAAIAAGAAGAGAAAAGGVATLGTSAAAMSDNQQSNPVEQLMGYTMDSLFRVEGDSTSLFEGDNSDAIEAAIPEFARIFINAVRTGALPEEDADYAADVIARNTGITQQEAEQRIEDAFVTLQTAEMAAMEAADEAREASAYVAMWMVVSLLVGAFVASFAATIGGRQRDL